MLKKFVVVTGMLGTMMALAAVGCSGSSSDLVNGGDSGSDEGDGSTGLGKDGGSKKDSGSKIDGSVTITDGGSHDSGPVSSNPDGGIIRPHTDAGTIVTLDAGGFDGGTVTADGGSIPACFMSANAEQLNGSGPVAGQNRCNATQIAAINTSCFGATSTSTECQTIADDNADCYLCIEGSLSDGGLGAAPVVLPLDPAGDTVIPNVEGCVAALSAATVGCKSDIENVVFCSDTACEGCSDDTSFNDCFNFAETDNASICAQDFGVNLACVTAVNSVSPSDQDTKCGASATDFSTAYTAIATTMCGP